MYYYFCSDYPIAIKLNGTYFATLGNDVMPCDFEQDSLPLIEACPLTENGKYLAFFPNEEFLSNPPEWCSVTNLKGGFLIKFYQSHFNGKFGIYAQSNFDNTPSPTATIFNDGTNKLSVENHGDFYIENLNFSLDNVKTTFYLPDFFNKTILIVCFSGNEDRLLLFNVEGKIKKIFERVVQGFSLEGGFSTYERLKDIAKHSVTTFWTLDNGNIKPLNKKVGCKEGFNFENLNDKVIPFAFLEEFSVGGNFKEYLACSIKENADKLGGFFGEYMGIMPPPLFRKIDEIGLVYSIKSNLYIVEYFSFIVENKKITNISRCD